MPKVLPIAAAVVLVIHGLIHLIGTTVTSFVAFTLFTAAGVALVRSSVARPRRTLAMTAGLGVPWALLRRQRLRMWSVAPLMFEDQLPDEMQVLGLSVE